MTRSLSPSTLLNSFSSWLVWLIFKDPSSRIPVPQKIAGYKLVREISKVSDYPKYATGIYSRAGKRFFIKTWTGRIPNFDYFDLVNEYFFGRLLHRLLKSASFTTPKPLTHFWSPGRLSVIFEYAPGRPLSQFPARYQKQILTNIVTTLNALPGRDINLPRKGTGFYLASCISLFLASLLSRPGLAKEIFVNFIICLTQLPRLVKSPFVISHRDLNLGNVTVGDHRVYLLDCGSLALTPPGFDQAYLARSFGLQIPTPSAYKAFFDSYIYLLSVALWRT